jgi:uncharacterized protein (TIGR03083 family)
VDRARYLELLATDGQLLQLAAGADLQALVPTCPGWTVSDLVSHVAQVYEHKIACIRLGGAAPDPWPPQWPQDQDHLTWLGDAHRRLLQLLTTVDLDSPSWTWWPQDQTAGFWVRRMAQETAIHRADAQGAFGEVTSVDTELAVDGIDELLALMLAGDWSDEPQTDSIGTTVVAASGQAWRIDMQPDRVTVNGDGSDSDARVAGAASDLLLWLWGRSSDASVLITGDRAVSRRLRERIAIATQ